MTEIEEGLYSWQKDNLVAATQSVDGCWLDDSLPSLANINTTKISTDTRTIQAGDIFLALSGDNFDGHDYAKMAVEKGASAVIVEREITELLSLNTPQLLVKDSRLALGQLAAYRRRQHKNVKIIAITGSSGKTTVKEMLGSIFNRLAPTLVTRGNLNNDLGVPMMLLELSDAHQYAIMELGANHVGEIAYTADIVMPDVSVVLNIGTAHLGEFGGREGICKAKSEIYQVLGNAQTAVVPELDEFADKLRAVATARTNNILGFGKTDVTVSNVQIKALGSEFVLNAQGNAQPISLPLAGEHNVTNAMAVTACAMALGVALTDIAQGLQAVKPPRGRLYSQQVGKHLLIDDTYNANPHSILAGAQVVVSQDSDIKVLVLGDVGELGDAAKDEHFKLGQNIAKLVLEGSCIDYLYTVGEFAADTVAGAKQVDKSDTQALAFKDKDALLAHLQEFVIKHKDQTCTMLFKGSRFMKMESLFDALV